MSSAKQHYEEQQREAHHRLLHSFNWLSKTSQLRLANHNSQRPGANGNGTQPGKDDIKLDVRIGSKAERLAASIFRPDYSQEGHR
jgi:hypothetical protein